MSTEAPEVVDPTPELEAMKIIAERLKHLDTAAQRRVLRWAGEAFGAQKGSSKISSSAEERTSESDARDLKTRYPTLAEFFAAANPTQENDKALVAGYWTQI